MAFTIQELANISNAALDYFIKDQPILQTTQDRPLMSALREGQKTFSGGKGSIKGNVKGDYTTQFLGFSHDDTVTYKNPANIKQFEYIWKELHAGIELTLTELKNDGISVTDSLSGKSTSEHSDRELHAISNILEDKLEDMKEGAERSFNQMLFLDGTQSAKVFAGLQAILPFDPTTGTTGGIDRATNIWWRNRSLVGASKIVSSTANQTLSQKLRYEVRQLRRYGGRPSIVIAGSTFIDKLETEIQSKGYYTQTGFANMGKTDIGLADIAMKGVGTIQYDPTLDDLGIADYAYFLDPNHLKLYVMDGEDWKQHTPARPADKYVLYRAITWTGTMLTRKMNAHAVYQAS